MRVGWTNKTTYISALASLSDPNLMFCPTLNTDHCNAMGTRFRLVPSEVAAVQRQH